MAMKQFKAESKKLLDLMINSIYTNKEIFIRELISNASDAIDKLYFKSLTDETVGKAKEDYRIFISIDKEARTITISDNGIGMTKEQLEKNLGTIAHSGSLEFKKENQAEDIDIIGQFGVGFYSSFMVASHVSVLTRAFGCDEAFLWESSGVDGYTIDPAEKSEVGTEITLVLKEDTDSEQYSEFLDEYRISELIKKYSDYVHYPIQMYRTKSKAKERPENAPEDYRPEYEEYTELETLNSMTPLWKRSKSEVSEEDYNNFYKEKFFDFSDPLHVITSKTEGSATYNALLFIPGEAPYDFYSKDFEKGLQLYASGVLIMDKCADLLPDHFRFVRGIVDSQDLSLNISREMLQKDNQLKLIRNSLEKKIKNELNGLKNNDREKYEKFWKQFGRQIKFGVYEEYGAHADLLKDLLLFYSSKQGKLITISEYIEKMPEEQTCIYYAAGEDKQRLSTLPACELVMEKGFDVLFLTEDVDEFCLQILREYDGKEFKNINSGDLGLESDEDKKAAEEATNENKELFDALSAALEGKVKQIKLSAKLKSSPVCISTEGPISLEMEKILNAMPNSEGVKTERILEINGSHPVFEALKKAYADNKPELVKDYAYILYCQALLIEGLPLDDPAEYAQAVCRLMV